MGTLQYLAPEVLHKQPAGYASDVYSWAVTVNEVATGIFPFSDCTRENPKAHTVLDFGYGRCVATTNTIRLILPNRMMHANIGVCAEQQL